METYVSYDIADDNIRNSVMEKVKDFGLERVQKSLYKGNLDKTTRNLLKDALAKIVKDYDSDIKILVQCSYCKTKILSLTTGEYTKKFYKMRKKTVL